MTIMSITWLTKKKKHWLSESALHRSDRRGGNTQWLFQWQIRFMLHKGFDLKAFWQALIWADPTCTHTRTNTAQHTKLTLFMGLFLTACLRFSGKSVQWQCVHELFQRTLRFINNKKVSSKRKIKYENHAKLICFSTHCSESYCTVTMGLLFLGLLKHI